MSDQTLDQSLHLPSLVIKNFRGIDELTIPRLGRVTLLAGKNGVGKTTVLDAVRVWAARGRPRMVSEVLLNRDELVNASYGNNDGSALPDFRALFYGNRITSDGTILIGPVDETCVLRIGTDPLLEGAVIPPPFEPDVFDDAELPALEVKFHGARYTYIIHSRVPQPLELTDFDGRAASGSLRPLRDRELPREVLCNTLGPAVLGNTAITEYLDYVTFTPSEEQAIEALNLVTHTTIERVAMVGSTFSGHSRSQRRRAIVKVKGQDTPASLRSLGDGAVRVFGVALALANSADGFLLIDEAENGIHHSIQARFWKMVLQTAERNNVQVIATTHSWDCVTGFAEAANELEDVEGVLVRLERPPAGLRPITYDESRLKNIAKNGIEVR